MSAVHLSDRIAAWLLRHGVEQVFAVTGGGAMFLNQALGALPGMRCTFMHHEQACAMAAEGYARITGKPAVVMVTTGPGAINAMNGVHGAYTDSIPMIVISGQVKRETCLDFHDLPALRQLGDQEGPTLAMARPITKFAQGVRAAGEIANLLPAALACATRGRPGPVWLDIPLDVQSALDDITIPDLAPEARVPVCDEAALQQAAQDLVHRILAAERPLILGGSGVRLAGVEADLLALVERSGIPLATAWTHDLIASDHPLFAGRPGTIGTRPGNFCLQAADLVIVLGSRLNIRQTSYNWQAFAKHATVVQVDVDPAELCKPTYRPDVSIQADLRNFLPLLTDCLAAVRLPSFAPWAQWCREMGERYAVIGEHKRRTDQPIDPYALVAEVFAHLRPDDMVVCGNASACILPFQVGRLRAGQRLFSNSGAASMGYDLPAAIGAAVAAGGQRRVICFAGDGSLQMNIQELQTLKTHQFSVVVIVINNAGYTSIKQTHSNFFGPIVGATPASGVEFPDYAALAKAYGLAAVTLEGAGDLARLPALLAQNGPLLIDVRVDEAHEFVPRIKSRVDADGKFLTPELDDMHPFLPADELARVRASGRAIRALRAL